MFKIENSELAERVERHKGSPDYGQGRAVLLALCESIVNGDLPDDQKLAKIQTALLSDLKLQQFAKRHDLESGNLLTKEAVRQVCKSVVEVIMSQLKDAVAAGELEQEAMYRIVDDFYGRFMAHVKAHPEIQRICGPLSHD